MFYQAQNLWYQEMIFEQPFYNNFISHAHIIFLISLPNSLLFF